MLSLLVEHDLVRHVLTIQIDVRPLGGDSFCIKLDASNPTVGEAKEQIEREQGTRQEQQELFHQPQRADGKAVREFDAEPEELKDAATELANGDVVVMSVLPGDRWERCSDRLQFSDGNLVVKGVGDRWSVERSYYAVGGQVLREGRHYWEVEILNSCDQGSGLTIGVIEADVEDLEFEADQDHSKLFMITAFCGALWGHVDDSDDEELHGQVGALVAGDRVGVLLDLDKGSLDFFKNGERASGYPAGHVTGPLLCAVAIGRENQAVRLHWSLEEPRGSQQSGEKKEAKPTKQAKHTKK